MSQKQIDTASDASSLASPKDVAQRMVELLESSRSGELWQQDVVNMIRDEFGKERYRTSDTGSEFLYQNASGGLSIDKAVRKEFLRLTSDTVVWERAGYWRKRRPSDPAGRQAD